MIAYSVRMVKGITVGTVDKLSTSSMKKVRYIWYTKVMQLGFDMTRFEKPTTKATSNRASLIEMFVTRINNSRITGGYKPYTAGMVASKMSHHKTEDLIGYYKQLDGSKNFCALWHWQNMPKKMSTK